MTDSVSMYQKYLQQSVAAQMASCYKAFGVSMDQPNNPEQSASEPLKPGPLPEPLFLLHTGDLFGNERNEWEVEANSGQAVDEFAEAQAIGAEIGLHPDQAMRAYAAQEVAAAVAVERDRFGWRPIESAPKTGKKLILWYLNRNKKARTVMARWQTDEQAAETDHEGFGLEAGWYECIDNWDEFTEIAISEGEPAYWMPLPPAPESTP